jgi:DDE superfamily endonuclease
LIGRQIKTKRYFSKGSKLSGVKQDGSREWISVLSAVTAAGRALSPGVIYQSATRLVREDWLRDWDTTGDFRALVTSTESGWINADLAFQWLKEVIDKETRREGGRKRLLLLDGHSTHLTLPFLEACDEANIILALIPAHSTHIMQPLDVGLFGPLSRAYSAALEAKQSSLPLATAISKGDFWRLFEGAYKAAFTSTNIRKAFAAAGIYPREISKVLVQIPDREADGKAEVKTEPGLTGQLREIRRKAKRHSVYRKPEVQELIGSLERAAMELEFTTHDRDLLRATVERQRKKNANSKQLQHPDLPDLGKGIFFTPGKIAKAREWEEEKVRQVEEDAAAKAARLVQRERDKAAKEAEKERRRARRVEDQQKKAIERLQMERDKAERKAERKARTEANQRAREERKLARQALKKRYRRTTTTLDQIDQEIVIGQEPPNARDEEVMEVDETPLVTRTGRPVRKPARFRR